MSQAVLTGPLIDFGSTYLSSALVRAERPGLLSKRRRRIGQFGIGFFSSFMIATDLSVVSRPFDAGLDATRTLRFTNGIVSRPILLRSAPADFGASACTRVSLKVSSETIAKMLNVRTSRADQTARIEFGELVANLCPMLDVDVFVQSATATTKVHSRTWMEEDRETWLTDVVSSVWLQEGARKDELKEAASRLALLDPADPSAGLACIAFTAAAGIQTIGALKASSGFNQYKNDYWGAIDHEASGPSRSVGPPRAKQHLPRWASEQATQLSKKNIPFPERQYAAQRVASFGGDATSLVGMHLNREWATLDDILQYLIDGNALFAPVKIGFSAGKEGRLFNTVVRERHSGWLDHYYPGDLEYFVSTLEAPDGTGDETIYEVPTDEDPATTGFCALLTRRAAERGFEIEGEIIPSFEFAKYVGEASRREMLVPGKIIKTNAVKLEARPRS
jgi:hypothetical protein